MAQLPAQVNQFGKALTADTTMKRLRNSIPQGTGVTAEQICSVIMSQVRQNPDLVTKCNQDSLMAACFDVAKSGLIPDGILGQAYIVPFKGQAQFIPGYRGLITLAMNSGQISEIWAKEVRQSDHFVVHEGTRHEIEHHVDYRMSRKQRGEIVAVYACANFKNGGTAFEIMPADEVDEIRQQAPGANSSAWRNHWAEMAKKTVLRRLAKWLPQSVQRYTQMEEHFESTGEVTHLSDDLTIEASPGDWSEAPAEGQTQEAQPPQVSQQAQPAAQEPGNGQGQQKRQSSRARAAVGEGRKKANGASSSKQQRQPQAQADEAVSQEKPDETPPTAGADLTPDEAPHDPQTGEVLDEQATEVSHWDNDVMGGSEAEAAPEEGRGETQSEEEANTSAIEVQLGKRGPDIDGWFEAVIARLNEFTHPQQVERLRENCKPQLDQLGNMSKHSYDEAHKLFDDRIAEINESPF